MISSSISQDSKIIRGYLIQNLCYELPCPTKSCLVEHGPKISFSHSFWTQTTGKLLQLHRLPINAPLGWRFKHNYNPLKYYNVFKLKEFSRKTSSIPTPLFSKGGILPQGCKNLWDLVFIIWSVPPKEYTNYSWSYKPLSNQNSWLSIIFFF